VTASPEPLSYPLGARGQTIPPVTFVVLCGASMLTATGFTGLQSVLPAIGRQIGIPDSLVAAIFGLSAAVVLVSSPFWGRQADLRGRKPIILVGIAGFIASMLGCAAVVSIGTHRLAPPLVVFFLFLFARGLNGAVGAAAQPATQAFVADHTGREARTQAIATLAGAAGFGTIFGPLITPLLAQSWLGLAGPLYAFTLAGAAMLLLAWRMLPDDAPDKAARASAAPPPAVGLRTVWGYSVVRRLLVFGALANVFGVAITQTMGFAVIDRVGLSPMRALPYITTAMLVGSATTVLGQWGLIRLFRMQPQALLRWGAALACLGSVAIVAAPGYPAMVAGYGLFCLGLSFARPGVSAAASLAVEAHAQAGTAGAVGAIMGAAPLFSPFFLLLYGLTHAGPFVLTAAVLAGLFAYAVLSPRLRRFSPETA
jgi:MFS family permease